MPLPNYHTGTVSVSNGDTTIVGTGTVWSGVNVRASDRIYVAGGAAVEIKDVTDVTHLTLWSPWTQGDKSGATYIIVQDYPARVIGVAAAEDAADMLSALTQKGLPIVLVEPDGAPDPSLGAENQWAEDPTSRQLWKKTGGAWVEQAVVAPGTTTFATLRTSGSVFGSWWSDISPFTVNPAFRVRDRLVVDDGCLTPGTNLGDMPNTRLAADMNSAGGGWAIVHRASSHYVLSSNSNIAVAGQTATRLQTVPGAQDAIGVLGMALGNHPTLALPAWGGYFEGARLVQNNKVFGVEVAIGNAGPDVIRKSVYGPELDGMTSGLHINIGGDLDESTHLYRNASVAIDILPTSAAGAAADRGIVFVNGSVADQGGGVFDAINHPSGHRHNWFRNNLGADELQAYITAKNTTLGAAVQSIEFGTSDKLTLTAPIVQVTGTFQAISGSSGVLGAIGVGRTASEGGLVVPYVANQLFTGTLAGDLVVEASTNMWFAVNNGVSIRPFLRASTAGAIDLTGALQVLSGSSGTISLLGVGRTVSEGGFVVPATANQIFTGTAVGDFIVEAGTALWLAANNAVSAVPGIKIETTGLLKFPQYGAGILQSSASGTVTSSLNIPNFTTVLSGLTTTAGIFTVGRTSAEAALVVPGLVNTPFTGTAAGDFVVEAYRNIWLAVNNSGTVIPLLKGSTTGVVTLSQYGAGVLTTDSSGVVSASLTFDTDATLAANSATRIPAQSAIKSYVDNAVTGLKFKVDVRVASTANVNIASAPSSIDGVTLSSGDPVLLKNQTTASENGPYIFNGASAAMTRRTDGDTGAELVSATFPVREGTANQDTWWTVTNDSITIGSTSITFTQTGGAGTYSAGTGLLLSGNQFSIDSTVVTLSGAQSLSNKSFVSPALGTPASGVATNLTGLSISTGLTGAGTGVLTALGVNIGSAGAPILFNGALGTPSSGTVTNLTGTASININGTVGVTTPAAGSFTTAAASTSVTTPVLAGGSAASSSLTLESTTGAGTTDSILFKTGSQVQRGTINTAGKWAIGPNAVGGSQPAALDINLSAVSAGAPVDNATVLRLLNASGVSQSLEMDAFQAGNKITGFTAEGVLGTPTNSAISRNMILFGGYGWSNGAAYLSSAIQMQTGEAWSNTAGGSFIDFYVTPLTTKALTQVMKMHPSSGVSIASATDPGAGNLLIAGLYKSSVAPTAVSGAGPIAIGSASTINSRMKVNLNGTDYWIPLSATAF